MYSNITHFFYEYIPKSNYFNDLRNAWISSAMLDIFPHMSSLISNVAQIFAYF